MVGLLSRLSCPYCAGLDFTRIDENGEVQCVACKHVMPVSYLNNEDAVEWGSA